MQTVDLHTHTIASGHGTRCTVTDLAKAAAARGLTMLGVTDHGPATPGAASVSYFRALPDGPRTRFGVTVTYGAEVNILDGGALDLPAGVLDKLDYVIASMHHPPRADKAGFGRRAPGRDKAADLSAAFAEHNTNDYLTALADPHVRILGHFDRTQFPADLDAVLDACAKYRVLIEINEASLGPAGYHSVPGVSTRERYAQLLAAAAERRLPVLLSSDSHGAAGVGLMPHAEALIKETGFPAALVANGDPSLLASYLARRS